MGQEHFLSQDLIHENKDSHLVATFIKNQEPTNWAKHFMWLASGLFALGFATLNILNFSIEALSGRDPYDFPNYYFSGIRLLQGRPIYDLLAQEIFSELGWVYNAYMADPPFAVVILAPLALLDYSSAWWAFLAISISSIVVGTALLLRNCGLSYLKTFAITSLVLASQSSLYLFKRNHLESLLFLGLCVCVTSLKQKRYLLASLVLGVLSAIKLFPAFILLTIIRKLGIRYFVISSAMMLALSLLGVIICDFGDPSFGNLNRYLTDVLQRSEAWLGTVGNFSLRSVLVAFGDDPHSLSLTYLISVIIITTAALYTGLSKSSSLSTCILTGTASALLLSPLAWLNYLVLLVPPAVYFYEQHYNQQRRRGSRVALLIGIVIYWPTYIDVGHPDLTKAISLFPTIILAYLVFEPHIYRMCQRESKICGN